MAGERVCRCASEFGDLLAEVAYCLERLGAYDYCTDESLCRSIFGQAVGYAEDAMRRLERLERCLGRDLPRIRDMVANLYRDIRQESIASAKSACYDIIIDALSEICGV